MRVRKVLMGVAGAVLAVAVAVTAAIVVDFGTSIYAEYRLSRAVREAAGLGSDPFVAILGIPFIPQAISHHYNELEIKANAVDHAMVGKATLEATMHSINLAYASWLIKPHAKLPVGKLESRIIIDSVHLGRYLGISDLMVEAPPQETNDATGGTTESGISSSHGLVFTGTPKSANFDKRVSVSVDLSMAGDDRTTLVFTPTGILTGPDTADQKVPVDKKDAVLAAFRQRLPDQKLPFAVAPTAQGARGSDVIIEGITEGVTITLDEFKQS
ncbi:mannan chain length control protein LmeA [Mycobacterium sp. SM1]|uniref:mannan chain length control protein LmeA n=1 Tax=Mycobacterium sp. SM1 TaxID=2816243 RepID=UPI001BCE066D|nr:mannan chain length control protein LmeA [Mycobacterium sp. SM1]MBS4727560.1 mannan chain length control protein LmeA [Mycobacterium sp. SM1]